MATSNSLASRWLRVSLIALRLSVCVCVAGENLRICKIYKRKNKKIRNYWQPWQVIQSVSRLVGGSELSRFIQSYLAFVSHYQNAKMPSHQHILIKKWINKNNNNNNGKKLKFYYRQLSKIGFWQNQKYRIQCVENFNQTRAMSCFLRLFVSCNMPLQCL